MVELEAGKTFNHPQYGELIYIDCYNYHGVKYKFKSGNKVIKIDIFEVAKLK